MLPVKAVIGANYGDEGKGREVDRLISLVEDPANEAVVVRHNSGAQAGHTVVVGDKRHVFSHFGSGTLRGAPTLLTHKFVANPVIFNREWDELEAIGITPKVYCWDGVHVSTPLDALLNQVAEALRHERGGRHGSCGIGFGETIQRVEHAHAEIDSQIILTVGDQHRKNVRVLKPINTYTVREIARRGWLEADQLSRLSPSLRDALLDVSSGSYNWRPWVKQLELMASRMAVLDETGAGSLVQLRPHVVFEGAQGLELHMKSHHFPHVTRSRTGLEDIVEYMTDQWIGRDIEPHYCTRSYMTRHGAGTIYGELTSEEMNSRGWDVTDLTNVPNPHQGSLRYSMMYSEAVHSHITRDLERVVDSGKVARLTSSVIVMSCADQAPAWDVAYRIRRFKELGFDEIIVGRGPDSADTEIVKTETNMGTPAKEDVINPPETSTESPPATTPSEPAVPPAESPAQQA